MIDLEDMRCFVEVVQAGGLSRAAQRLGMSKSILSRRITVMESDLGVQLLIRSTRGVAATEAGLELRTRAERILAEVTETREAVAGKGSELSGRLRITAPLVFGELFVAPILEQMARDYPQLHVDAAFSDRVVDLLGEGFDVAIRIGEPREQSLVARRIAPVHAAVVASPAYLDRAGRPQTPAQLSTHECLIYGAGHDWQFQVGRKLVSIRPVGRLRADSGTTIVQWARAGLGIGNAPDFLVEDALRAGTLEHVLPAFPQPEFAIYALRPPGPRAPAKVRVLIDALVARISGKACEEIKRRPGSLRAAAETALA